MILLLCSSQPLKKPDNIGFNKDNTVKLIDFGLAKCLHPNEKNEVDLYLLTGNTGSLRYMAPEVARNSPYDQRVDTYSFGILFWEICSLATPYAGYDVKMHTEYVVGKGDRPKPERSWPDSWIQLMKSCWQSNIFVRPKFDRIVEILEHEIWKLTMEDEILVENVRLKKRGKQVKDPKLDNDTNFTDELECSISKRIHNYQNV